MTDEEQTKRLSEAIDALLRGEEPQMELDDLETIELLRIAHLRHRAGQALADVGLTYQELLRRVLQARMIAREMDQSDEKVTDSPPEVDSIMSENPEELLDPLEPGYGKLLDFLDFRPRAAPVAPPVQPSAGQASPAVASQARPQTRVSASRWPRRSERTSKKAEALSEALDRVASSRKRNISVADPDIAELVQVAQLRRFVGQSLAAAGSPYKRRLWTVLRMRLATALRRQAYAPERPSLIPAVGRVSWQHAAAAAAVIALLLAAFGPLATTGMADHPIAHLLNLVEEHVGVEEVEGPPPTQVPTTAPGELIAPEDAAQRLGFPVRQPAYLPEGFQLARSSYHAESITSPEQGMSVLIYTIGGVDPGTLVGTDAPRLVIYQEQASSDSVAVMNGQAEDVVLAGHVSATYAQALWAAGDQGTLVGADASAKSLIFDHDGARVVITYRNGDQVEEELLRVAESMLSQ